jgi:hypothetical protein
MDGFAQQLRIGDHCCQFFETAEDLRDLLVPYFKQGLEANEACVWVTSAPYGKERAVSDLRGATDDFDRRQKAGQIEVYEADEWYLRDGCLDTTDLVPRWLAKKDAALAAGYFGLRVSGNLSFVTESDWPAVIAYERAVTEGFRDQPVAAVCSYCLERVDATKAVDLIDSHAFGLRRRCGHWDVFGLAHPLDSSAIHQDIDVGSLLQNRLAVHLRSDPRRVSLDGPIVWLPAEKARDLGLLVHELASNAIKFGALSGPDGRLSVRWHVVQNGSRRLCVEWNERSTKWFFAPQAPGLGTRLLAEKAENCQRTFTPTGMICTFEVPLP